jgi:proteasome lid subunit RPN8/RPN11
MKDLKQMVIRNKDLQLLLREAEYRKPLEACALMLGLIVDDAAKVLRVEVAENIDRSSVSFSIDPLRLLKVYTEAEKEGLEVVGIFHSHPAPPSPSPLDLKYMALNPGVWLIMSSLNGAIKAYHPQQGRVKQVEILVL